MATAPKPAAPPTVPTVTISTTSAEQAPFIYFDGASCLGVHHGAIQIELAANILTPYGTGVQVDVIQTAHLRCSPDAAMGLRQAIDNALAMLLQGQQQASAPAPSGQPH
jgi:hypothetical protein